MHVSILRLYDLIVDGPHAHPALKKDILGGPGSGRAIFSYSFEGAEGVATDRGAAAGLETHG